MNIFENITACLNIIITHRKNTLVLKTFERRRLIFNLRALFLTAVKPNTVKHIMNFLY